MSQHNDDTQVSEESPTKTAHVSSIPSVAPIWFVPIAALLIAAWLALKAWQETGPTLNIVFEDAAGMAVGKTEVRYREVVVGKVVDIKLADDYEKVQVKVDMDPHIASQISKNSRFWVVSPRVSLAGVSGLNTLLSGVYIEMDPGDSGQFVDTFEGLSQAPAFRSYDKGTQYRLNAKKLGSLDVGSPIYHRDVKVGWVTSYQLIPEKQNVQLRIFIEHPYDALVKDASNFWNVSGFGLNFGADGIEAKLASVASLVAGGLEFSSPPGFSQSLEQSQENKEFYLFEDKKAVQNGSYSVAYPYLLRFNGSIRGLKVGAPVEFKGMQVGEVTSFSIDTDEEEKAQGADIAVKISIQPERINRQQLISWEELDELLGNLVSNGMRAQLKTSSIITGALFVDLVPGLEDKQDKLGLISSEIYSEIPTAESQYQQLSNEVASIIKQISAFPFESVGKNVDQGLARVNTLIAQLQPEKIGKDTAEIISNLKTASQGLDQVVEDFDATLKTVDRTISSDSRVYNEMVRMMEEIAEAADSFEKLTDELNRHPNSLVVGRGAKE
ncbi:intermembrane transport protein PqiB [Agarilytica rhodophyticola]|uniref:PqiB family protein n=1 Tax=Agarilytica rhodophyticola TaxID=1737490 RepID=UPI000B349C57|nr:MlaD family protein [Agarilytica rhodophyticola]